MNSSTLPVVVSRSHSFKHYRWGSDCEAWSFVDNKDLSIKLEMMPPGTEEVLHYHEEAQQFFFITKGRAVFEVDEVIVIVHESEGINIEAGRKHRIMNKEEEATLEFLICSQPSTENDRHNLV